VVDALLQAPRSGASSPGTLIVGAVVSVVVSTLTAWLTFQFVKRRELAESLRIEVAKLDLIKKPELAQTLENELQRQREVFHLEEERDRKSRIRHEILRWANPILGAVGDLRARLNNIVHDGAYVALDPSWDPESNPNWSISHDYFMCSTLYLFANYFARTRMLEETLSFGFFSSQAEKDRLFDALRDVSSALSAYPPAYKCFGLDVEVFHLQQRALGALIIHRENDKERCWTYPEFIDGIKKAEISVHFDSLRGLLESVRPDEGCRWRRLIETNRALAELDTVCRELLDLPVTDAAATQPKSQSGQPDSVKHSNEFKTHLTEAQGQGVEAVRRIREQLGDLRHVEPELVLDLLLSFRAVSAWQEMVALVEQMPPALARATLVREQSALALNRTGQGEKAERVLFDLIAEHGPTSDLLDEHGPTSETYGLLGRVYEGRWEAAQEAGNTVLARDLLDKAIDAYVIGFDSDWRDAFPGINAVRLMELREPPDPRRHELLPVVTYSAQRRIRSTQPDYSDYAMLLELAVLDGDEEKAMRALPATLAAVRESWEPASTLQTLRRLRLAREERGPVPAWMAEVEQALQEAPGF
jgi:hypothetical protein